MFGLESTNSTMQSEVYVMLAAGSVCFLSLGLYPLYQDPRPPDPEERELAQLAAEMDTSTPTFVFTAKQDGWELGHADPPENVRWRIKNHLVPLIKRLSEDRGFDVLEIRGHTDGIRHDARVSNMDARSEESVSELHERIIRGFDAASNTELGLQRALQVKAIFSESMTPNGELGNIKYIHAFSAGEFIRPDGEPVVDESDPLPDDGRRRVEIRLSRLPACRSSAREECSRDPDCVWVAESVGCVSRKYSPCFQYSYEAQCLGGGDRCSWLSPSAAGTGDAESMCVPKEFMDWASSASPDVSSSTGALAVVKDPPPRREARKKVCVLDGTGSSKDRFLRAKMVCRKLEASGWECDARRFLYPGADGEKARGYSSHIVLVKDRHLWKALMEGLEGTKVGAKIGSSYDPGTFHGLVSREEVASLPECRHANAVFFLGTDFAGVSPL